MITGPLVYFNVDISTVHHVQLTGFTVIDCYHSDCTFSVLFCTILLNVMPLTTRLFCSFSCLALALSAWILI